AVDACDGSRFMRTAFPEQTVPPLVTGQARVVFLLRRVPGIFRKSNGNGFFSTAGFDVCSAWTVTRLTPMLFAFGFRVSESLSHHGCVKVRRLVDMACRANFTANIVFRSLSGRRDPGTADIGSVCHECAARNRDGDEPD